MSSENVPPIKKLKQATLNFFKPSASVEVKKDGGAKSNKRKSTSPTSLESPSTKTAKLSKPLVVLPEHPNSPSKVSKGSKTSVEQNEINDHKVSSSSEPDCGSIKSSNGRCCLIERFVCKISKENQEISSTNDGFGKSLSYDEKKSSDQDNQSPEPDCIIVSEDSSQSLTAEKLPKVIGDAKDKINKDDKEQGCTTDAKNITEADKRGVSAVHSDNKSEYINQDESGRSFENLDCIENTLPKDDQKGHKKDDTTKPPGWVENVHEACSEVETVTSIDISKQKDDNDKASEIDPQMCKKDEAVQGASNHPHESNKSFSEGYKEENVPDDPANDSSLLSASTPLKLDESNGNLDDSVTDASLASAAETSSTPCKPGKASISNTPKAPPSAKRGRKVDSAKKAEMDAARQRLKEQKEHERAEKKRKIAEEKAEKERLKQEQKDAKEKEKQELKEKQQKEKEEKEKIKEEERKKRDEERLQKEEERKKKQAVLEAKIEEKKKKDEDKKLKEEEKLREEEEKKKKAEKTKQAFQSFFIKPKETPIKPVVAKPTQGIFSPFEVKKDMHLAPTVRRNALFGQSKSFVDSVLKGSENSTTSYVKELQSGSIVPKRTGRVLRTNPKPSEDIEVVHDPKALQTVQHKVKLLQFHTDYRPPYYGTWKKIPRLNPRNPWKKDESFFDYEVDSDDEWEEEEPGESLSCSDGEEEKGEKNEDDDEEEEDGWMVPHGYLSEDEGCNEDDEITPEKLKLQQLAKAKAWEEEQKRKLQAAPVVAVGCFFQHSPSTLMSGDVRLLYEFRGVVLCPSVPIPTSLVTHQEQEADEPVTPDNTPIPRGPVKKGVPDEAMPDLIRLVHGNITGIKRLIRDFRIFWLKKETEEDAASQVDASDGKLDENAQEKEEESSFLNDSVQDSPVDCEGKLKEQVNANIKEEDEGHKCSISKRQLEIKINAIAVRDKRAGFHKTCWYVHDAVLKEFNLEGLVCNSLVPPEPVAAPAVVEEAPPVVPVVKEQRSIMDFALSKEELAKMEKVAPKVSQAEPVKRPLLQRDQMSIMNFARPNQTEALAPSTPLVAPVVKKVVGQTSIMNFAKSRSSESDASVSNQISKQQSPMETDDDPDDVIIIDSTADVVMSLAHRSSSGIVKVDDKRSSQQTDPKGPESPGSIQSNLPSVIPAQAVHKVKECSVYIERMETDCIVKN